MRRLQRFCLALLGVMACQGAACGGEDGSPIAVSMGGPAGGGVSGAAGGAGAAGAGGAAAAGAGGGAGVGQGGQDAGGRAPKPLRASVVAAGRGHACAILEPGEVWCWGENTSGELGDGTKIQRPNPVRVMLNLDKPLTGARALALGYEHTCALVGEGEVWCWGDNFAGQIGDRTTTDRPHPVRVQSFEGSLSGALSVAAGGGHTCVLMSGGEARCWGDNSFGQLGDGTETAHSFASPVLLSPDAALADVQALALGGFHSCALTSGGQIRCWGANGSGELGDGTSVAKRPSPAPVRLASGALLTGALALAAGGGNHSCVLMGGGQIQCWGANQGGQLGNGTTTPTRTPTPVLLSATTPFTGAQLLALGVAHSCAVLAGGHVSCWGDEAALYPDPVRLSSGDPVTGAKALALGVAHSCALLGENEVNCWGSNRHGQLGDGTDDDRAAPAPVLIP